LAFFLSERSFHQGVYPFSVGSDPLQDGLLEDPAALSFPHVFFWFGSRLRRFSERGPPALAFRPPPPPPPPPPPNPPPPSPPLPPPPPPGNVALFSFNWKCYTHFSPMFLLARRLYGETRNKTTFQFLWLSLLN